MVGHTPNTQHITKLTSRNGASWLIDIELLAQMHKFADLLLFRGTYRSSGWLGRAVKRTTAYDDPSRASARHEPLEREGFSESFLRDVDTAVLSHYGAPATKLRPSGDAGAGGSGGESTPATKVTRPPPGELEDGGEAPDAIEARVTRAAARAITDAAVRAVTDAAARTAATPSVDAEFHAFVSKLMLTDPTRAAKLLMVNSGEPTKPKSEDTDDERSAQLCALMKSCISAPLLPRFLAFDDPQDIYDEVAGWELDLRSNTLPLLRTQLVRLQMQGSETPTDFFTRAKGIFLDLDVAGEEHSEATAINQMLNAVVHDRFSPLKTYFVGVLPQHLRFEDVVQRFNRVEVTHMNLPQNHPNYPPYLRATKSPAPAYASHVFPPAGGRGTPGATGAAGGRNSHGGGRGGRGNGGAIRGGRGSLLCTHCNKTGHLVATCYQLHPHLAPSSSRPKPDQRVPTAAEYSALLAELARFQGH